MARGRMLTTSLYGPAGRSMPHWSGASLFSKAWTDQRRRPRFEPDLLLAAVAPRSFRWTDLNGLVPRGLQDDPVSICETVKERFAFLSDGMYQPRGQRGRPPASPRLR